MKYDASVSAVTCGRVYLCFQSQGRGCRVCQRHRARGCAGTAVYGYRKTGIIACGQSAQGKCIFGYVHDRRICRPVFSESQGMTAISQAGTKSDVSISAAAYGGVS